MGNILSCCKVEGKAQPKLIVGNTAKSEADAPVSSAQKVKEHSPKKSSKASSKDEDVRLCLAPQACYSMCFGFERHCVVALFVCLRFLFWELKDIVYLPVLHCHIAAL
jgi:hypothetical protein